MRGHAVIISCAALAQTMRPADRAKAGAADEL
jgi:hypothetical protein